MAESKIPLMEDDVEIIKKLGNKPGSENKLQTPELKSKFDEGSVLLKAHLNKVIGILNTLLGSAGGLLDGGNMMGALNMNGYRLFGISNPTDWNHAANKGYVDTVIVPKTLTASGWVGDSAPYTQTVAVDGITDGRRARVYPAYGGVNIDTDLAMREACAAVSYAKRDGQNVIFTCLEDKPGVDIPVMVEVYV